MKRLTALFMVALFIGLSAWTTTDSWKLKVSPILLEKFDNSGSSQECLIMMRDQMGIIETSHIKGKIEKTTYVFNSLSKHASKSQHSILQFLNEQGIDYRSFYIINGVKIKADMALLETLANRSDVLKIINDPQAMIDIESQGEPVLDYRGGEPEWGIKMIQADSVWTLGYKGDGIVIAGQDTGYNWDNPLLKETYRGWDGSNADHQYNWHDAIHEISPLHGDTVIMASLNPCGLEVDYPCDDHDHGTHTMGTMVGEDDSNAIGVAPEAQWIGCRCMERGYGSPTTYIECFEWFLAPTDLDGNNPDPSKAPHVINNSWACPEMEGCEPDNFEVMNMVVEQLRSAGIVVVVSAGNEGRQGCETVEAPAAIFEGSFTIGASNVEDILADFSSKGPVSVDSSFRLKPNVVAPGRGVRSVLRDSTFASWSGTSMAGPHVAGAVALIISANPILAGEVDMIEDILEQTAEKIYIDVDSCGYEALAYPNPTYGYGRINVLKAVEMALTISSDTELPSIQQVLIYPNPTNENITITIPQNLGQGVIKLFDASGKQLITDKWSGNQQILKVSNLPVGTYYIRINDSTQRWNGKFIKI